MRLFAVFILSFFLVLSCEAQEKKSVGAVLQEKINSSQKLLEAISYRVNTTSVYFEDRTKSGQVTKSDTKEVVFPNKWRTVSKTTEAGTIQRIERVWDGKFLYEKVDDGKWEKYNGGASSETRIESGRITRDYQYLGPQNIDGTDMEVFQIKEHRLANKFSMNSVVEVHFIRTTTFWFTSDAKLMRKVEENEIEGRPELSRETATYEYEPKDLKIEAPAFQ